MNKQSSLRHIAIIMDGNGRWASARGLPRTAGHKKGIEAVKRTVEAAIKLDIKYLTLFGFSSENWSRPIEEVKELMRLLRMYLRAETAELHRNNIKLQVIGNRSELDDEIVDLIENAEILTKDNTAITVVIALNYGGRNDIIEAGYQYAKKCLTEAIEPSFEHAEEFMPLYFSTSNIPDPDILIRTSGEQRISNFLLWQCAYSELIFTKALWPDFNYSDLEFAIREYKNRERRFGGLKYHSKGKA
jgi:undecaprenyl diphosphate synthase